jgi:hypothetical protein
MQMEKDLGQDQEKNRIKKRRSTNSGRKKKSMGIVGLQVKESFLQ